MNEKELDVWDNLLIRACKSNGNVTRRLRKIWRMRCLMPQTESSFDPYILSHLLDLLDARKSGINVNTYKKILDRADPAHVFNTNSSRTYWEHLVYGAVMEIRFTEPHKEWAGFRNSCYFRNLKIVLDF